MAFNEYSFNDIMFKNNEGNQLFKQMNILLKKMIENDEQLITENKTAPILWERKWLNDSSVEGYKCGTAVWMNTNNENDVLKMKYSDISVYIDGNKYLSQEFKKINNKNQSEVNAFFKKAILGTVSQNVPPIFVLGNMLDKVQIRVLSVNMDNEGGCKEDPTTSAWYDFYEDTSLSANRKLLYEALFNQLSIMTDNHMDEYHIDDISDSDLNKLVRKKPFDVTTVSRQQFFSHNYCNSMQGYDFIKEQKYQSGQWYRLWNSGYLEQGGIVENYGEDLINVTFLMNYDYPSGRNFYQEGFKEFKNLPIDTTVTYDNRYCAFVTPILYEDLDPYQNEAKLYDGVATYNATDVTNMSNSGFSFMNVDTEQQYYKKYSFYVSGFTTATSKNEVKKKEKNIFTVKFIDTHGD